MISFEEVGKILDDIADGLPEEFYRELNGGIILLPDLKFHPLCEDAEDLITMGEYHHHPHGLGRYIVIYYGSFARAMGHLPPERAQRELRRILLHEFTHHLQSLGGVRDLELDDARRMDEYRRIHTTGSPKPSNEKP